MRKMWGGHSWPPPAISGRSASECVAESRLKGGSRQDCLPHKSPARAVWGGLRRIAGFAAALLRHLADESPYQRSLEAHGRRPSPCEWRRFSDERYRARFTRPKCC